MKVQVVWLLAVGLAVCAGWTDWRSRRIPNWLTVSGAIIGFGANAAVYGWGGVLNSLLGMGLGLVLLLPFVLIKSLGAGDWKLVGAIGAFLGPSQLLDVLMATILVAGVMALALIVIHRRVGQTFRNIVRILGGFLRFHMPEQELTLDNPQSLKVPFGVAVAISMFCYGAATAWRIR
jgi:prepilin peptidase CpaA